MLVFATATVPVCIGTNPPLDRSVEEKTVTDVERADEIINELNETSPDVKDLMHQLKSDITKHERTVIRNQLRYHYETALYQGNISKGLVTPLALMLARTTANGIHFGSANRENSIVICFLCFTVEALHNLVQMVTSGFMHAIFVKIIASQARTTVDVDVYIRASEFNLGLASLTSPQDTGWLLSDPMYVHAVQEISYLK